MQHIYNVAPVHHQPDWPANDNESETRCRDRRIAAVLLLLCAVSVITAMVCAARVL